MRPADRAIQVPCPTCARRTAFTPENRWRPFCSERCRSIDLGAWASERFRVAASPQPSGTEEDSSARPLDPSSPGG